MCRWYVSVNFPILLTNNISIKFSTVVTVVKHVMAVCCEECVCAVNACVFTAVSGVHDDSCLRRSCVCGDGAVDPRSELPSFLHSHSCSSTDKQHKGNIPTYVATVCIAGNELCFY